jgi:hypothetical protein
MRCEGGVPWGEQHSHRCTRHAHPHALAHRISSHLPSHPICHPIPSATWQVRGWLISSHPMCHVAGARHAMAHRLCEGGVTPSLRRRSMKHRLQPPHLLPRLHSNPPSSRHAHLLHASVHTSVHTSIHTYVHTHLRSHIPSYLRSHLRPHLHPPLFRVQLPR